MTELYSAELVSSQPETSSTPSSLPTPELLDSPLFSTRDDNSDLPASKRPALCSPVATVMMQHSLSALTALVQRYYLLISIHHQITTSHEVRKAVLFNIVGSNLSYGLYIASRRMVGTACLVLFLLRQDIRDLILVYLSVVL